MAQRSETLVETQEADGDSWSVTFTPKARYRWEVTHIAVSIPGWISGQVRATITIGGNFVMDTPQGHRDSADGSPIEVYDSQPLTVEWTPFPGGAPLVMQGNVRPQGIATIIVNEVEQGRP